MFSPQAVFGWKNESVLKNTKMVFWEDLLYMPQSTTISKSYRPERDDATKGKGMPEQNRRHARD